MTNLNMIISSCEYDNERGRSYCILPRINKFVVYDRRNHNISYSTNNERQLKKYIQMKIRYSNEEYFNKNFECTTINNVSVRYFLNDMFTSFKEIARGNQTETTKHYL